ARGPRGRQRSHHAQGVAVNTPPEVSARQKRSLGCQGARRPGELPGLSGQKRIAQVGPPAGISPVYPALMAKERVEMPASEGVPGLEAPIPIAPAKPVAIVIPAPARPAEQRGQDASPADKTLRGIVPVGVIPERLGEINRGTELAPVFQRIVPVAGT